VLRVCACRIDEAAERAAAVRAELQEGRKKLRELVDAEKESRKRKRAAALALATVSAKKGSRGARSAGLTVYVRWLNGGQSSACRHTALPCSEQCAVCCLACLLHV
jgi:hypothetical protein